MSSFRSSCEAVLRGNDRGSYTLPSPKLYPHQWAWDSAFAAIGWAHLEPARAWKEIESLMSGQWEDGRIPHILFHDRSGDYFPGPDFWETEWTTSISQPPVWATCVRRMVELTGDRSRLPELVPLMDASHQWFHQQRDPLGWGAVAIAHPWESGLDNSPVWDAPMSRVDVSNPPSFERRDVHAVLDPDQRPTDGHYLRYACLVKAIAKDDFGPGPFAVYDPMMTAILARAEDDLVWLASEASGRIEARGERLRQGLREHLWDDKRGRFIFYDARADETILSDVIGCYAPLFANLAEPYGSRLQQGLTERFAAEHPFPSTSPGDPAFDARRYWRGPTWINTNWLLQDALGAELRDATLRLVQENGFYEYFDATTGQGLGADSFTWTAALSLDLLGAG